MALEVEKAVTIEGKSVKLKKLQLIADALADKAVEGDVIAIKEVFDRIDGRLALKTEGPGKEGEHTVVVRLIHEGKPKGMK